MFTPLISTTNPMKPVIHDNPSRLWCGPAALATITGVPTKIIHEQLRQITGRKSITGTYGWELTKVLSKFHGFTASAHSALNFRKVPTNKRPTLMQLVNPHGYNKDPLPRLEKDKLYLIIAGNHWVVVWNGWFCDSHTEKPELLHYAPNRRKRVETVFEIMREETAIEKVRRVA